MQEHYIPKYLHAQPQLLWWELDEFMILLVFSGIGIMVEKSVQFALLGFILMKIYGKLKYQKQDGLLKHLAYWWGLLNLKGKFPESWKRELVK